MLFLAMLVLQAAMAGQGGDPDAPSTTQDAETARPAEELDPNLRVVSRRWQAACPLPGGRGDSAGTDLSPHNRADFTGAPPSSIAINRYAADEPVSIRLRCRLNGVGRPSRCALIEPLDAPEEFFESAECIVRSVRYRRVDGGPVSGYPLERTIHFSRDP